MTTAMGPPPPRNRTAAMGPPPPRNPNISDTPTSTTEPSNTEPETKPEPEPESSPVKTPMAPPPSIDSDLPNSDSDQSQTILNPESEQSNPSPHSTEDAAVVCSSTTDPITGNNDKQEEKQQEEHINIAVPYTIPPWSEPPCHPYFLEVLKCGAIVDQFDVYEKGAYMFGRVDLCDFVLEHPTISRFHAVLQFKKTGGAYIYDLSSTHGTFVNKNQVQKKVYVEIHVGDVIRFGHSSRLYIFQGPSDLMLPEGDLKSIKTSKVRQEMHDMEASLLRAKREASLADGISWGMDEDAVEEIEDDLEEITWQTYKGQLTEKQEKTRDKVLKRLEKIANMKKEIDAIRAKDISQGGLTQGQQTQIARNEQRMSQIVEELENLEDTLNESIHESMGARGGRTSRGKKKGTTEDEEDEYMSDDDEFYDRTRKKSSKQKDAEKQSIETADSLLDKKDNLIKEMDDKRKLLLEEKNKVASQNEAAAEAGDALDAYMSGLSSQLVLDKTEKIQNELNTLQSELERVLYLLKIADPTGEAATRRESKAHEVKPNIPQTPAPLILKKSSVEQNKRREAEEKVGDVSRKLGNDDLTKKSSNSREELEVVADASNSKTTGYTVNKPQWLGAIEKDKETKQTQEATPNVEESDEFVDYKDRKEVLGKQEAAQVNVDPGLENAAPGLIIRKRKQLVEDSDVSKVKDSEQSSSVGVEIRAEDAVALLLKHTRGYQASDDAVRLDTGDMAAGNRAEKRKIKKKPKKVLGPEKPPFLDNENDFQSWVPPAGQSGDGRTSLNDRYGY